MNNKGFTLIELLVVVLIIGILAAIALPQYMKAVEKSRASEALTLLGNLANAEHIYNMSQGTYTEDLAALDITLPCVSGKFVNTNNFKIESKVTSTGFEATASRITSAGSAFTSGDRAYSIKAEIDANGVMTRTCVPKTGDTAAAAMCKTIANGASDYVIK